MNDDDNSIDIIEVFTVIQDNQIIEITEPLEEKGNSFIFDGNLNKFVQTKDPLNRLDFHHALSNDIKFKIQEYQS